MGGPQSLRAYWVYGLHLRSPWPLPCPEAEGADPADVEFFDAPPGLFLDAACQIGGKLDTAEWFRRFRLRDGSDYLRWSGNFEFVVSADGRWIACHSLTETSREAFSAYLLGQVLSFAMIKQGVEPLHATAVSIDGETVGFVGGCGYGKSSLGAAFLQAGHPLVTDDLLVIRERDRGLLAFPGPARIKLFPDIARSLLGQRVAGTPMNHGTPKLVIPLAQDENLARRRASPLKAIYVMAPPPRDCRNERITMRPHSPRRAAIELIRSTFNTIIVDPARLERQFDLAARLARQVRVKSLSFPRRLALLPAVREAILSDVTA